MTIIVTEEDIRNGEACHGERCPVARALNRAFGVGFISVGSDYFTFTDPEDMDMGVEFKFIDVNVQQSIKAFDRGERILPFQFELEINDYLKISEEEIRIRAYEVWVRNGHISGQEKENYFQALHELRNEKYIQFKADSQLAIDQKQEKIMTDYKELHEEIKPTLSPISEESQVPWYIEIEERMPQLKDRKFRSINSKISWMFNNLKTFKRREVSA